MRRAVVVDDERLARLELCSMLAGAGTVVVVGEAGSVAEGLEVIAREQPDLLLLDVQLGKHETGFDLIERAETSADVIFVTAYDQHAVRAFEVNAVDYLLKPVHADRLREALERLEREGAPPADQLPRLNTDDRLFIRVNERWRFLKVIAIKVIEGAGDFTRVVTSDGAAILIGKPLREWEARLPESLFTRIHRSTIVNLDAVERVEEWSGQTFHVYLKGIAKPYQMSRRYAARLKH